MFPSRIARLRSRRTLARCEYSADCCSPLSSFVCKSRTTDKIIQWWPLRHCLPSEPSTARFNGTFCIVEPLLVLSEQVSVLFASQRTGPAHFTSAGDRMEWVYVPAFAYSRAARRVRIYTKRENYARHVLFPLSQPRRMHSYISPHYNFIWCNGGAHDSTHRIMEERQDCRLSILNLG